ncbi:MAG: hypothetical protein CME62_14815 [Halobacteriovoraceae bacterium]|nr:hypothetical protein [Halobacteriovoraceae bacterium]|tara:strand:+ start:5779 stop:6165 length:387 start_codon:yes stop_codon:yes gene_type:complete
MKTHTRENTHLFLGALVALVISAFIGPSSYAANKPINCKTNFGEKSFTIDQYEVAFHAQDQGRSISSVLGSVTKKTHKGFNKTVYQNGYRHLIHIENEKEFSSDNDFMAVISPKGHKMTYPLICSRVQ